MSVDSASARPPCFTIVFAPTPACADPIRNVRHLLKAALRRWGLRAVSVVEVPPPDETEPRP